MRRLQIVVLGTMAGNPYAGMAWMHMQIAVGLHRLGHDVYYVELTSNWPYDPNQQMKVASSDYALAYLSRVAACFAMEDRWAYRRSYSDGEWFGLPSTKAKELLAAADMVINVAGATCMMTEGFQVRRLVYLGTDPVIHELALARGDNNTHLRIEEHSDCVTYGENIGTRASPIPPLPRLRAKMRQPVLLDCWECGPPVRKEWTTVANWKQIGLDTELNGETYYWSKHHEFLKFIELPKRISEPVELAMNLGYRQTSDDEKEAVPAMGLPPDTRVQLEEHGWKLREATSFTTDPWPYREYIQTSCGEWTVARDLNVRLRSGWFSERSACYLAAGRPVITQDTGFGHVLPTGEGLFAFNTMDDVLAAFDTVRRNYTKHSHAARTIAQEYFRAETVLAKLLADLGY